MRKRSFVSKAIASFAAASVLFMLMVAGTGAAEVEYYGYSKLNDQQKTVYDTIHNTVTADNPNTSITFSADLQMAVDDIEFVLDTYEADHPEVFWIGEEYSLSGIGSYIVGIELSYEVSGKTVNAAELSSAKAALQAELDEIREEMASAGLTTDKEKALWLHDKTAAIVDYKMSDNDQNVYGALVEGEAVCAGYARLYQLLLQENGIKAWTVTGTSVNPGNGIAEPHAWTLMWLDGNCLYTDVTWDDQGDELYHLYYCRTLDEYSTSHFPSVYASAFLPECAEACSGYLCFDEEEIFDEAITADALAAKVMAQNYDVVLYDASDELLAKIKDNSFMSEVIGKLDSSYSSCSYKYAVGCGTEIHLEFYKWVVLSGEVTSFGDPDEPVTIELYHIGSTVPMFTTETDADNKYSLEVLTGNYIMHVSKTNHVTRQYRISVE